MKRCKHFVSIPLLICCFQLSGYQAPPIDVMRGAENNMLYPNQTPRDRTTSEDILRLYQKDYYLSVWADSVQIDTINGIVTLSGRAPSQQIRLRLEQKAKQGKGAKQVINNLDVLYDSRQ